jgi:hypothetical protein
MKIGTWELVEAIDLIRQIEKALIPARAHCALGGSVLMAGYSDKDLDIYIYPRGSEDFTDAHVKQISAILATLGITLRAPYKASCEDSTAFVFKSKSKNKTVDFFFLNKSSHNLSVVQ